MAVLVTYNGPYQGIDVSAPDIIIPREATPYANNIILRQNYISSRPPFKTSGGFLDLPGNVGCNYIGSVQNNLNEIWAYALDISGEAAYWYNTNGSQWNSIPFINTYYGICNPSIVKSLGNLYFVNGSQNLLHLYQNNIVSDTTICGARYLFQLAQTLLMADTFETGGEFPQRVRWCATGDPTAWDPNTNVGAGFDDLLDVSDIITGAFTIGSVAYLLRKNGITQITPTGNGIQPFNFNHLWAAEQGMGQYFPGTYATYGSTGFMLAQDNVYLITPTSINTIADKVIEAIMGDIYDGAYTDPSSPKLFAWVLASKQAQQPYLTYELAIAGAEDCVIWSYSLKGQNWMRHRIYGFSPTGNANQVVCNVAI